MKKLSDRLPWYGLIIIISLLSGVWTYRFARDISFGFHVVGNSMSPVLQNGEYGIGINLKEPHPAVERGDIICFTPPMVMAGDVVYIKRVIGLPGETVDIKDSKIYIDDVLLDEPYLENKWTECTGPYHFEVPSGHYLVLGDNRNNSYDSRSWDDPYVDRRSIWAKPLFVYKPHYRYLY